MNKELKIYIKENILPLYEKNDWAHQVWHIYEVIERSLKLADNLNVDINMVYTIACFHDLGCQINRENHEQISAEMFLKNEQMKFFFNEEERNIIAEAIIDHRASLEYHPRSIYGEIIATADRFTNMKSMLKSTHSFTLQNFIFLTFENMFHRSWSYIENKYGKEGYAKSYPPNPSFDEFLKEVEYYKNHQEELKRVFIEVDKHIRKVHDLPKIDYEKNIKRYHSLDNEYQNIFHSKVYKISLNGGFSCPNIKNGQGCIFCSHKSGDFAGNEKDDLVTQFETIKKQMEKKWPNGKYIAYFQVGTNTYAPLNVLKEKYESVINLPGVVGLSISTRSDAISEETLDYLSELNQRTYLTIELGLQSIHESSLKFINRGHALENFKEMVLKLQERNIRVVVHIINGLPDETKEMMIETVKYLNKLKIDGIKIHMLQVLKDTPLSLYYEKNPFPILTKEEFVDIVTTQLQYLTPNIIIHRLTGDPKSEDLIAPSWVLKKFTVLNDIDKKMIKDNIFQGLLTR